MTLQHYDGDVYAEGDRAGKRQPASARDRRAERAAGDDGGHRLVCARCRSVVTHASARIDIDGLHEHTQVNPHGFVWTFRCFSAAPGCVRSGGPSSEFTWFPGHTWQIEQCRRCGVHLGWVFRSPDRTFHGLITSRIVEERDAD